MLTHIHTTAEPDYHPLEMLRGQFDQNVRWVVSFDAQTATSMAHNIHSGPKTELSTDDTDVVVARTGGVVSDSDVATQHLVEKRDTGVATPGQIATAIHGDFEGRM